MRRDYASIYIFWHIVFAQKPAYCCSRQQGLHSITRGKNWILVSMVLRVGNGWNATKLDLTPFSQTM